MNSILCIFSPTTTHSATLGFPYACSTLNVSHANAFYERCTHARMHRETRANEVRQLGGCACIQQRRISQAIYVWASNINSAPWAGVDLSPLKRCCHNAFILSTDTKREHVRPLLVRMCCSSTAGVCWMGEGKGRMVKDDCVIGYEFMVKWVFLVCLFFHISLTVCLCRLMLQS